MHDNNNNLRRHQQLAGIPPSLRPSRSRSGSNPATLLSEIHTDTSSSGSSLIRRSKSTTKSRTNKYEDNLYPSPRSPKLIPKKPQDQRKDQISRDIHSSVKLFQQSRGAPICSPSAWALSPGRAALPIYSPVMPKPPSSGKTKIELGGGVNGVLKYFRQKKKRVSPEQAEEFHGIRIFHNRLLQWRFINALAESSRTTVKIAAEAKLFNVWVRILLLRNSILEKRTQTRKLRYEIKLYKILNPQMCLLKEWGRLESKNSEAIGRMTRKLSAISTRVPLVQGSEVDNVLSVYDAMTAAMGIMDTIEAAAAKFLPQVEKICFLITELTIMEKQQREYMKELLKWISMVASLEAKERSLRVHLFQAAKDRQMTQMIYGQIRLPINFLSLKSTICAGIVSYFCVSD